MRRIERVRIYISDDITYISMVTSWGWSFGIEYDALPTMESWEQRDRPNNIHIFYHEEIKGILENNTLSYDIVIDKDMRDTIVLDVSGDAMEYVYELARLRYFIGINTAKKYQYDGELEIYVNYY
jgi:hypothetical protein